MNTGGSCGSAEGTEQLAFIHGGVAVRRHVRLLWKSRQAAESTEQLAFQDSVLKGAGGNPQSPGAFGTFLAEKYT